MLSIQIHEPSIYRLRHTLGLPMNEEHAYMLSTKATNVHTVKTIVLIKLQHEVCVLFCLVVLNSLLRVQIAYAEFCKLGLHTRVIDSDIYT